MVDLKAKPYCLPDEDVRWVEETIAGMTPEEKVGQLFFQLTASQDENYLRELMEKYHLGGCRYNPMPGAAVQQQNRTLQKYAKVPVFIACNTEAGGDGACADGTNIGSGIKIGATRNNDYAYALGKMANEEAAAIGCNMAFAPVCDIHYNWENTEIVTRAFGNDPVRVAQMSKAYMDGLHTIPGFACTAKHFPGNGLDFRDAHLSNNVNTFSVEEWDKTYGMVYKTLIDGGLDAIMGGHIMLPEYARAINPALKDEDMMPATLSPEIMTTLLRGKLGFNGMVVTDASHMVGMTDRMTRREMLPASINAGCDMFLFFNDPDEDFNTMLEPITPERYKRIMIVHVKGAESGMGMLMKAMGMGGGKNPAEMLKERLCEKGFDAFIYESPLDAMKKQIAAGEKPNINLYFAGKNAIDDFVSGMDLVITLCDVSSGRPSFGLSKGGGEIPWYVFELPVVVIGCGQPTMLADVPQARTYINTYDAKPATFDALVDDLMAGPDAFKGRDPIDSFCGLFDARL